MSADQDRPRPPGLEWRTRASGARVPYWIAPRAAVKAGFQPYIAPLKLYADHPEELAARCYILQAEALEWMRGTEIASAPIRYDGTLGSLCRLFQSHPDSPFRDKRADTREFYTTYCKLLEHEVGAMRVAALIGPDFRRWYARFKKPAVDDGRERVRRAQSALNTCRRVIGFGVELRLDGCAEVAAILREMRFDGPSARKATLTYAHTVAIIAKAHELGRPSIALAQALAFDLSLRQRDIIGEWTRVVSGTGGIEDRGWRWDRGLLWSHIDDRNILTKPTSKSNGKKEVSFALNLHALVLAEIDRVPLDRRIGAVVLDERAGRPYRARRFSGVWRTIATAAGVPRDVWQMDSRAGGLTESTDAGADLETARHQAGHSHASTTARYSRGGLEKTSKVALLRTAHRAGNAVGTASTNALPTRSEK